MLNKIISGSVFSITLNGGKTVIKEIEMSGKENCIFLCLTFKKCYEDSTGQNK